MLSPYIRALLGSEFACPDIDLRNHVCIEDPEEPSFTNVAARISGEDMGVELN
jgi:hypothetical protein